MLNKRFLLHSEFLSFLVHSMTNACLICSFFVCCVFSHKASIYRGVYPDMCSSMPHTHGGCYRTTTGQRGMATWTFLISAF